MIDAMRLSIHMHRPLISLILIIISLVVIARGDVDSDRVRRNHAATAAVGSSDHHHHSHHEHDLDKHHHRHHYDVDNPKPEKPWSAATASRHIYTGATAQPITDQLSPEELPREWDWCNTDKNRSFCTSSWNQHIPQYCGSCYVHGALHAANDRIKLLLDGKHDLMLARQVIINCGPSKGLGAGCDGGEVFDVFEFMFRYGLPDESCQNYLARSMHHDPMRCDAIDVCMNCMPSIRNESKMECWEVNPPIKYYIKEYGVVTGEEAMMNEIYARGPITCAFASVDDFDYNYRGGIYVDRTNATDSNHDVEVVGWGVEPHTNIKYWKARNSWGTYWGENSFFRILRGENNMRFEEECVFATFDVSDLEKVLSGKHRGGMFGVVSDRRARITEVNYTAPDSTEKVWNDRDSLEDKATRDSKLHSSKHHHHTNAENEKAYRRKSPTRPRDPASSVNDNLVERSPSTTVRHNHHYYKEKYAHRWKNEDSQTDGHTPDDTSKENVNMNLNLNLNFKHGQPYLSDLSTKVKHTKKKAREQPANGQTGQYITGEELDRQLADESD